MTTAAEIMAAARSYIDTPVFHRGRTHHGIDCLGLIIRAGVDSGAMPDPNEGSWPYHEYGRLPNGRRLVTSLDHFLVRIELEEAVPGDVVALSWGASVEPMHLAIRTELGGRQMIVHANPKMASKRYPHGRVLEQGYAAEWVERSRLAWRYPGIVD